MIAPHAVIQLERDRASVAFHLAADQFKKAARARSVESEQAWATSAASLMSEAFSHLANADQLTTEVTN